MKLSTIICATIVYITYTQTKYYSLGFRYWYRALKDYQEELRRLDATILREKRFWFPVGTVMVSKDQGWLPTDEHFPRETELLRQLYAGQIGYCGKFGVFSCFRCSLIPLKLFRQIAGEWAQEAGVSVVTMIVNSKHVRSYQALGATVLASSESIIDGLNDASGVMMMLDLRTSARVQSQIERSQKRGAKNSP